jgi:hypothetical protein
MIKGRARKSVRTRQEMWSPQWRSSAQLPKLGVVFHSLWELCLGFRVYNSVRQRYFFLGLASLFASPHLPFVPKSHLLFALPRVPPPFVLLLNNRFEEPPTARAPKSFWEGFGADFGIPGWVLGLGRV